MLQHIENKTSENIPALPFRDIADFALNQGYELSLVFVDSKTSKKLNSTYRQKNNSTNILSFPLSKTEGEILIDIKVVKEEAGALKEKLPVYLAYIFIHGLVHLKGLDHGSKMEKEEKKIRNRFRGIFKSSNLL